MAINSKGVQLCICGQLDNSRKSFFSKFDLAMGAIIAVFGIPILLAFAKALSFIYIPYSILFGVWLIFSIVRIAQRHSLACSIRWSAFVTLGSLGGFWFLGL